MSNVTIVVSEHATKPLIHINDLKTVETAVHKLLCMNSLPEPQQRELANDIIYHWVEDTGDNGRHCVNPLVHVLVSERLTALYASMMEDPFMCHVMPAESGPRSMDWILVLHFDAYKRVQDMAFTESRKLLRAGPGIDKFIEERVEIQKDSIRPNECYAVTRDLERAPLDAPKWKTTQVQMDGAVFNVWQANALAKYASSTVGGVDLDQVVNEVNEAEDRLIKITGGERMFRVMRRSSDDLAMQIVQSTGRNVLEAIKAIRDNDLVGFFDQAGHLRYLANTRGHLVDMSLGNGKYIADLAAGGDGNIITRVIPVGSELRAEQDKLRDMVKSHRPTHGSNPVKPSVWRGMHVFMHYPPYDSSIQSRLGSELCGKATAANITIVTLRDAEASLVLLADHDGEVATSARLGNEIAKAFGGVIGEPARK